MSRSEQIEMLEEFFLNNQYILLVYKKNRIDRAQVSRAATLGPARYERSVYSCIKIGHATLHKINHHVRAELLLFLSVLARVDTNGISNWSVPNFENLEIDRGVM